MTKIEDENNSSSSLSAEAKEQSHQRDIPLYRGTINPELHQRQIEIETEVRQDIAGAWTTKLAQRFPEGVDVRVLEPDVPAEFMFVNAKMISEGKDPYYTVGNLYLPEDMVGGAESETQCVIREIWGLIIVDAAMKLILADGPLVDGID